MPLDAVDHVVRLVQVIQLCLQTGQHGNQNTDDSAVGDDPRNAVVQAAGYRPRPWQDVGQRLAARVPVAARASGSFAHASSSNDLMVGRSSVRADLVRMQPFMWLSARWWTTCRIVQPPGRYGVSSLVGEILDQRTQPPGSVSMRSIQRSCFSGVG